MGANMINILKLPKATVFKLCVSDVTRKTFVDTLHVGRVVGETTTHYKVWNPDSKANDGNDPSQAQLYAKRSPRIWCEVHEVPDKTAGAAATA